MQADEVIIISPFSYHSVYFYQLEMNRLLMIICILAAQTPFTQKGTPKQSLDTTLYINKISANLKHQFFRAQLNNILKMASPLPSAV